MTPPPDERERCPTCRKWPIVVVNYTTLFPTAHCHGCLRTVARCTC